MRNFPIIKIFVLFIVFGIGSVFCSDDTVNVDVKTGDNCPLDPKVKGKLQTILWKYKGNKVVELEPSEYRWYKFQDQAHLNNDTGVLTLQKLDKKRSGPYQSEIQVDGKLHNKNFNVVVIDPVPFPNVTCAILSPEQYMLTCSLDPQVKAVFQWSGPHDFKSEGHTLNVSRDASPESLYFCTAENKVSKNSTSFSLQKCDEKKDFPALAVSLAVVAIVVLASVLFLAYQRREWIARHMTCARK